MRSKIAGILVLILVILAGGGYYFYSQSSQTTVLRGIWAEKRPGFSRMRRCGKS